MDVVKNKMKYKVSEIFKNSTGVKQGNRAENRLSRF